MSDENRDPRYTYREDGTIFGPSAYGWSLIDAEKHPPQDTTLPYDPGPAVPAQPAQPIPRWKSVVWIIACVLIYNVCSLHDFFMGGAKANTALLIFAGAVLITWKAARAFAIGCVMLIILLVVGVNILLRTGFIKLHNPMPVPNTGTGRALNKGFPGMFAGQGQQKGGAAHSSPKQHGRSDAKADK